jgi:dihydrofolate reductase
VRKLRYNVAMSLDGFIAGPNGEYDWITPDPSFDFARLFSEFDLFVMGRKTFQTLLAQGDQNPTQGAKVIVFSRTLRQPDYPDVEVTDQAPSQVVAARKAQAGKDIWLFGGGLLFRELLDARLVDSVEVALVPYLLGQGIRLLPEGRSHKLILTSARALPTGIQLLNYTPRYDA